jgi:hypothetical protein
MIPQTIRTIDSDRPNTEYVDAVQQLSIAEIESISIEDMSSLQTNALKDVVNDAVRQRLQQHRGGTYTSAPKMTVAELNKTAAA